MNLLTATKNTEVTSVLVDKGSHSAVRPAVEWPTVCLGLAIYGMWTALTLFHNQLPVWVLLPLGAWVIAWHSSFQHEVVHGHPTRWRRFNHAFAMPALSLWLPFHIYKASHLAHHVDQRLTDPLEDPESKYVTLDQWQKLSLIERAIELTHSTLLGRLIIGPMLVVSRFFANEFASLERVDWRVWSLHLLSVVAVVVWLTFVCHMSLGEYIALFAYPGTSLLLLRSYAEHKASEKVGHRTAIVENASLFGLLFLHNNLHVVHHHSPKVAWYELPELYRHNRQTFIDGNGGLVYDGYGQVASMYLLRRHDQLLHPRYGDEAAQQLELAPGKYAELTLSIAR